eukprot:2679953-Rhodomonas_salina.3
MPGRWRTHPLGVAGDGGGRGDPGHADGHPHVRGRICDGRDDRAGGRHAAQGGVRAGGARVRGGQEGRGQGGGRGRDAQVHEAQGCGGAAGHPEHRHGHDHPEAVPEDDQALGAR